MIKCLSSVLHKKNLKQPTKPKAYELGAQFVKCYIVAATAKHLAACKYICIPWLAQATALLLGNSLGRILS